MARSPSPARPREVALNHPDRSRVRVARVGMNHDRDEPNGAGSVGPAPRPPRRVTRAATCVPATSRHGRAGTIRAWRRSARCAGGWWPRRADADGRDERRHRRDRAGWGPAAPSPRAARALPRDRRRRAGGGRGRSHALRAGVSLFIPGNARHRAPTNTGREPLRFLFVFPTDRFEDVTYRFEE